MNYKKSLLLGAMLLLSSGYVWCMEQNNISINIKLEKFELFNKLPVEIQNEIIKYFNFRDMKNFRLSSKASQSISKEIFHKQKTKGDQLGLELTGYAVCDEIEKIETIINSGNANINKQDNLGRTALFWMCYAVNWKIGILKLLIKNGAKLDLQDFEGNSAFMIFVKRAPFFMFTVEIVKFLIESGADLNLKNKDGKNALDLAISEDIKEIIEVAISRNKDFKKE